MTYVRVFKKKHNLAGHEIQILSVGDVQVGQGPLRGVPMREVLQSCQTPAWTGRKDLVIIKVTVIQETMVRLPLQHPQSPAKSATILPPPCLRMTLIDSRLSDYAVLISRIDCCRA